MTVPVETCSRPRCELVAKLERVTRAANGDWTLHLDLRGTVDLGDGRELLVARSVRVRANGQRGRKPRG